jgi:hypothetical protein
VEGWETANLDRHETQSSSPVPHLLLLTNESQAPEGDFADYFHGFLHNGREEKEGRANGSSE